MNLTSKISLYDILAMILPGGLLIWCLAQTGFGGRVIAAYIRSLDTFPCKDVWIATSLLMFAYIIGLVNHVFTTFLFDKVFHMRNNSKHILSVVEDLKREGIWNKLKDLGIDKPKGKAVDKEKSTIKCSVIQYFVYQWNSIKFVLSKIRTGCKLNQFDYMVVDKYYDAYTYSMKNGLMSAISAIEYQIAMLENFFIPTIWAVLVLRKLNVACICGCCSVQILYSGWICLLLEGIIITIFLWIILSRMKKVYRIVFENYEYYKRLEEKPKKKLPKTNQAKQRKNKNNIN